MSTSLVSAAANAARAANCLNGLCPNRCAAPVCGHPRPEDCLGAVCLVTHEQRPFPFDELVAVWRGASDRVTSLEMRRVLEGRDELVEERNLQAAKLESGGIVLDWRFYLGVGLAGAGAYLLWKKRS